MANKDVLFLLYGMTNDCNFGEAWDPLIAAPNVCRKGHLFMFNAPLLKQFQTFLVHLENVQR